MIFKLKIFLKQAFLRIGLNITKFGNSELVAEFLRNCYPLTTNIELIRLGSNFDGGYLIPNDLQGVEACFSPGVDKTASFETELAKFGIRSYMADYSVDKPPVNNDLFSFEKKFLDNQNNQIFMTLDTWVDKSLPGSKNDLLLQMDIEGWEYEVLLNADEKTLNRFRIIVIEFHGLISLGDSYEYKLINSTFNKLLKNHSIVHILPNNISKPLKVGKFMIPPTLEFTFLRNDRIKSSKHTSDFPHHLDYRCMQDRPDFILPDCWYAKNMNK